MIAEPPEHISAERLFRLLLRAPRPTLPVALPSWAAGGPFHVRAVTGPELFSAKDESADAPREIQQARLAEQLIALGLWTERGRVFTGAGQVGALEGDDFAALAAAVLPALAAISPVYGLSDRDAWEGQLLSGANHPSNRDRAQMLANCREQTTIITVRNKATCYRQRFTDRPDRYFGLPLGELTDGQWMAYRAARQLIETREG